MRLLLGVGIWCFLSGCQGPGTPIPVGGRTAALVGKWEGTYSSNQTGRGGSIVFVLKPGQDTATGDVLMIPTNPEGPPTTPHPAIPERRAPQMLRISFVRCTGDDVSGWLERYSDPDTGEPIATFFKGTLKGDRIEGEFFSDFQRSGRRYTGKWSVKRKGS